MLFLTLLHFFTLNANAEYYYISPDYRHELRDPNAPKNDDTGVGHDFPTEDPSLESYSLNQDSVSVVAPTQQAQIQSKAVSILLTNLFTTESRRKLARNLTTIADGLSAPYSFKSLDEMLPSAANAFAIANTDAEYEYLSDFKFGICWSLTGTLRKFIMLAKFDPNTEAPFDRLNDTENYLRYYASKIEKILAGEPVVIPGFRNLREFSSEPGIEYYLKSRMVTEWKTDIGTSSVFRNFQFIPDVHIMERTMAAVRHLLQKNIFPKIYITGKGDRSFFVYQDKHVLMPYQTGADNLGHPITYVWDPNFYGQNVRKYPTFIIKADKAYVTSHFKEEEITELKGLEFPPEEELETRTILSKTEKFCKKNPKWCTHEIFKDRI